MKIDGRGLSIEQKALARRFAAYRVYCDGQDDFFILGEDRNARRPGLDGVRLAMAPFMGRAIVEAMFEAVCKHQSPLPWEFERAAAIFAVAQYVGYFGKFKGIAEYLLTNEDVFADMAAQAVENLVRVSIRNETPRFTVKGKYKEFAGRIRRAEEAQPWLYHESDKWIRREHQVVAAVASAAK